MVDFDAWNTYCIQSFEGDESASQFIFFLESNAKTTSLDDTQFQTTWTLTSQDKQRYKQPLTLIHFYRKKKSTITISQHDWNKMQEIKRSRRSDWHACTQKHLQNHLYSQLEQDPTLCFDITTTQRVSLFKAFYEAKQEDLGSVPFFNALFGLFQFQLSHAFVSEWHMDQYKVTQTEDKEKMDEYLKVLRSLLGLRYLCTEGEDIVWLVNEDILHDGFLKEVLKLRKPIVGEGCCSTNIAKERESVVVMWSYRLLSLLHQHLK
jgi:hypothetical protein